MLFHYNPDNFRFMHVIVVKCAYATFTSPAYTAHGYNVAVTINLTVIFKRAQKVSDRGGSRISERGVHL